MVLLLLLQECTLIQSNKSMTINTIKLVLMLFFFFKFQAIKADKIKFIPRTCFCAEQKAAHDIWQFLKVAISCCIKSKIWGETVPARYTVKTHVEGVISNFTVICSSLQMVHFENSFSDCVADPYQAYRLQCQERQRLFYAFIKERARTHTHICRHTGPCRIKMPLLSWNGGAQQHRGDGEKEKKRDQNGT